MDNFIKKHGGEFMPICERCPRYKMCYSSDDCFCVLSEKLFSYEDTGFSPQEIKSLHKEWNVNRDCLDSYRKLGTYEHLRKLSEADNDNRCIILPFPFGKGKKVYALDEVTEEIVTLDCDYIEALSVWPSGELVATVDGWEIGNSDIGKTVFFSHP